MNNEQLREEMIKRLQKLIRSYENDIKFANWNIKMFNEDIKELMKNEIIDDANTSQN